MWLCEYMNFLKYDYVKNMCKSLSMWKCKCDVKMRIHQNSVKVLVCENVNVIMWKCVHVKVNICANVILWMCRSKWTVNVWVCENVNAIMW